MTYRILCVAVLLLVGACAPGTVVESTTTTLPEPTTTTAPLTVDAPVIQPCDPPDVSLAVLPSTVSSSAEVGEDFRDALTSVIGTSQILFAQDDGTPALALIRGSLPPVNWTGATERVDVRGFTAALGPLTDGVWAIAWAESDDDQCSFYSIFVYPPGTVDDARRVAEAAG